MQNGRARLGCDGFTLVEVLAALAIAACSGGSGSTPVTKRISIATGGTGGVFYPYGGGIAKGPYNDAHERRAVGYDSEGNGLTFYSPLARG